MSRLAPRLALAAALCLASGCYSIGYPEDERLAPSIAVPIFRNETLRRGLEHDLTRALRRELLQQTPYQLAAASPDVPVLRGTIERVSEDVLVAGSAEEVLYGGLRISVRFGVYRGADLIVGQDSDGDGRPDGELRLEGLAERDATRGEDRATASAEALRDLAEMIALSLQSREDDRYEPNDELSQAATLGPGRQYALRQREADWFRVEVPPRTRLQLVLYHSADLRMSLRGAKGEALVPARSADAGRLQEWITGLEPAVLTLEVRGGDKGADYQLGVELLPDDAAEPNQEPGQATPLDPGVAFAGLARDEDWFSFSQPEGKALLLRLEGPEPLPALEACDEEGLPLPEGQASLSVREGRALLRIEAGPARRVHLRVGGANEEAQPYRLLLDP